MINIMSSFWLSRFLYSLFYKTQKILSCRRSEKGVCKQIDRVWKVDNGERKNNKFVYTMLFTNTAKKFSWKGF